MSAHGRFTARPEARYCAALAPVQVARLYGKLTHATPAHGQGQPLERFPLSLSLRPRHTVHPEHNLKMGI